MSMLVFLEHDAGVVSPGSLGVLTKAAALDVDVAAVLVGGDDLDAVATEAGRYGAATVFTVADAFESPLPGPRVDVLTELVRTRGYDTVLFSNSVLAADVAAGLSARLDAGINWDLVDLELRDGQPVGRQPMLQDSVVADVGWRSAQRVALFRPGCDGVDGRVSIFESPTPTVSLRRETVGVVAAAGRGATAPSAVSAGRRGCARS